MSQHFRPEHLDVGAFAHAQAELSGHEPLPALPRLAAEVPPDAADQAAAVLVTWQASGAMRTLPGVGTQPSIHLRAQASVPLTCQRCLSPVATPLAVDRHFVFVADEASAAALDESLDDADVLVVSPRFDLRALLEDELLLALPLVARHAHCPDALPAEAIDAHFDSAAEAARPHPFAALAGLAARPAPPAAGAGHEENHSKPKKGKL